MGAAQAAALASHDVAGQVGLLSTKMVSAGEPHTGSVDVSVDMPAKVATAVVPPLSHAFSVPLGPHLDVSQPLATKCGSVSDAAATPPISADIRPYEGRFCASWSGDDGIKSDGDMPRSLARRL